MRPYINLNPWTGWHPAKNIGSCKYHQIFAHVPWLQKKIGVSPLGFHLLEELKNNRMENMV